VAMLANKHQHKVVVAASLTTSSAASVL